MLEMPIKFFNSQDFNSTPREAGDIKSERTSFLTLHCWGCCKELQRWLVPGGYPRTTWWRPEVKGAIKCEVKGLRRQLMGTSRPSEPQLRQWLKQNLGLGGVQWGHGQRLLVCLEAFWTKLQAIQEGKAVLSPHMVQVLLNSTEGSGRNPLKPP